MVTKLLNIRCVLRGLKPSDTIYKLSGRISKFRMHKSINFVELIDGSSSERLQLVINKNILKKPNVGSFISCRGKVVASKGSQQAIEFKVDQVDFLGDCDPETYPLNTTVNAAQLRAHLHLRPRDHDFSALLRVRSELEISLNMIMKQMNFFKVQAPCLTSNDTEGESDLFLVSRSKVCKGEAGSKKRETRGDYFDHDVYLSNSAQLHLESFAAALSRVYCLSPVFRAENSLTKRHLCEFQMFEAEEADVYELEPLMERVESIIKFSAQYLSEISDHKSDFQHLVEANKNRETFDKLARQAYIRMDYKEALRILEEKTDFEGPTRYGSDIGRTAERRLLAYCGNVPIFITNYPNRLKPFYMKSSDEDPESAECFDLIAAHGGEICGGSLREHSLGKLEANLQIMGLLEPDANADPKHVGEEGPKESQSERRPGAEFDWYKDLRKFGTFPHGGFGIGLERLIQSMLGVASIKDTIAFPRWAGHCPM